MTYDIVVRIKRDDDMKVEKKVKEVPEEELDNEMAKTSKDVLNTIYGSESN